VFSSQEAGAIELHTDMQRNRSKRYRAAAQQVDRAKAYSLPDAVSTLKKFPPTKFDQTVTVSFRLGVDPKQSDQMVRGTCPLPHGSGKQVRVLVFAEGESGRFSFEENALVENGNAVIEAVVRARPASAKGRYLEGVTISATMSPGVPVDPAPYLSV